jgi:hypothetical protein
MKTLPPVLLTALLALCACGGSDDDAPAANSLPAAPAAAQGLWTGTTASGRFVNGLVLGDGTYYLLYSLPGTSAVVAGVLQGNIRAGASRWSSPNAKDFNVEADSVQSVSMEGSYVPKSSFTGILTLADGSATSFASIYDPSYSLKPTLEAVAGTYSAALPLLLGAQPATLSVAVSGAVNGVMGGCRVSGAAEPRTDGNAYSLSLTLGPEPCPTPGEAFIGIAYLDAATGGLVVVAPNLARTNALLFLGVKPSKGRPAGPPRGG